MPTRSEEASALINSLEVIPADANCNARTPKGYCRNRAGYKTDHVGEGRCYLHGGGSLGRPITTGLYSKKMKAGLREEIEKLTKDPDLLNMREELAAQKAIMGAFLGTVADVLENPDTAEDFFIDTVYDKDGNAVYKPSARFEVFIRAVEQISKSYYRIVDAENKAMKQLDARYIYNILTQIGVIMDDRCGECPIRTAVKERMLNIKVPTNEPQ